MSPENDREIMFKVRDGDVQQLSVLFDRHHRMLYNFFLRLTSNQHISEDLVQEVFLRILKYRHTYKGDSKFTVWMFRIARNARIDYFRKDRRAQHDDIEEKNLYSEEPNPDQLLERGQDVDLLKSALDKIPVEDREVLMLSRFEQIKYREIAHILGCMEGTVKARVHRAMGRLRDTFFELSGETS